MGSLRGGDQGRAGAYEQLAAEYHRQRRPAVAIPLYESLIWRRPDDAHLRYLYAHALGQVQQLDEAIRQAGISHRLDPDRVETQVLLGALLRRAGRNEEAEEILLHAWRRPDPPLEAGIELSRWYLSRGEHRRAQAILDVCRERNANDPRVSFLLAESTQHRR